MACAASRRDVSRGSQKRAARFCQVIRDDRCLLAATCRGRPFTLHRRKRAVSLSVLRMRPGPGISLSRLSRGRTAEPYGGQEGRGGRTRPLHKPREATGTMASRLLRIVPEPVAARGPESTPSFGAIVLARIFAAWRHGERVPSVRGIITRRREVACWAAVFAALCPPSRLPLR
jgi:hypothetical protein